MQQVISTDKGSSQFEAADVESKPETGIVNDSSHHDIGQSLYAEALRMNPIEREQISRKVLLKLDLILLPMLCLIYLLGFLDKSALNYANAYGLREDLHLKGTDYSWIASISNFGYLVGAYPSAILMQKLPIGRFVGTMVFIWGVSLSCCAAAKSKDTLLALRFVLGLSEACIGPAWMLITTMFWTLKEAPFRMSLWLGCNGIAQMAGAGIAWGLGHTHGSISPWQLVFLVIGLTSVVFGILGFFLLPSSPGETFFFSPKEAAVATWRIRENKIGVKNSKMQWYQIREALLDPKTYLFAACGMSLGLINGAVSNFLTTLFKSFGFSQLKSVLYQIPGGAFQLVCTVAGGLIATLIPNSVIIVCALAYVPGLCGLIGIHLIPLSHQMNLAACLWMLPITGLAIILTWNIVASNTAGHTKRAFSNGVEFTFYAAGNIISPFFFFANEAPRYPTAIKALLGIYCAGIFCTLTLGGYMWVQNRRRTLLATRNEQVEETSETIGFCDRTDGENLGFRYKL